MNTKTVICIITHCLSSLSDKHRENLRWHAQQCTPLVCGDNFENFVDNGAA